MPTATQTVRARALHQACLCAKVCDDLRGQDTRVIDLTKVTPVFDYFVLTTGHSRRQMVSIAEEADNVLAVEGSDRLGLEGHEGGTWILHDYGDVVLHVFDLETRKTYNLEGLWADAESVDWREILNQPARADDESDGEVTTMSDG